MSWANRLLMVWYSTLEFKSRAVRKLVDGSYGWVLHENNMVPEECHGGAATGLRQSDGRPW